MRIPATRTHTQFLFLWLHIQSTGLTQKKLLFPQRTPSPDFIAEIIQNEGPDARHQITKQLDFIRSRIENHSYLTEQEIVNWYNIALRFAQFDTIIDNCPTNAIGHAELAFFYLKTKDYEKAESFFSAAANLGPPSIGMHRYYQHIS